MSHRLVFDRALALLAAAERHIDDHLTAYSDREDMAGTQLLLETLHKAAESAQREVIAIQRELAAEEKSWSATRIARRLRDVQMIARNTAWLTGQPLHFVSSPQGRRFDPIAAAYRRMAYSIEPRTELIFRSSEQRGYALSAPLLATLSGNLLNRGAELVEQLERLPTILYVQYPALAEGDVLQHLLISHEIAHLALRQRVRNRTIAEERFENAIRTWKETEPDSYEARTSKPRNSGKNSDEPRIRGQRWFTEIACDILAVRLAGPAYYLALCEHALVRQWFYLPSDGETRTHPHLAWRLSRAQDQLDRFYKEMDSSLRRRVSRLIEPYVKMIPDPKPKIAEEPFGPAIDLALDTLVADLDGGELIEQAEFDPKLLATELPQVLDQLDAGLAPAERIVWSVTEVRAWSGAGATAPRWSEPLDWRSILNGGFLHLLESGEVAKEPLRGAWAAADEARQKIVDHLRGSVELSEFQRSAAAVEKLRLLEAQVA